MHVQYGCGWSAPADWVNFDSSLTLWVERLPIIGRLHLKNPTRFPANVRYGDVVKGLPIADQSCDGVYASHVLEHLARDDFEVALTETYRVLKPGGSFRLVVPDLESAARKYLADIERGDPNSADLFVRDYTMLGSNKRARTPYQILHSIFRTSAHLWMWDYNSLATRLSAHGFRHVRRAQFNDSKDPKFRSVENEGRFRDAVAVEAIR